MTLKECDIALNNRQGYHQDTGQYSGAGKPVWSDLRAVCCPHHRAALPAMCLGRTAAVKYEKSE
jgi:hypothetical protein